MERSLRGSGRAGNKIISVSNVEPFDNTKDFGTHNFLASVFNSCGCSSQQSRCLAAPPQDLLFRMMAEGTGLEALLLGSWVVSTGV